MSQNPINDFLLNAVGEGLFPSFSYLVSEAGEIRHAGASGMAVLEPETIPASGETIYDLASLTKPLVTGLILGILLENGEITLDDEIGKYLPRLSSSDKNEITIRQLASHTSGFQAWHPFYLFEDEAERKSNVLSQIAGLELEARTGTKVIYSDLNFLLLGFILEKVTGLSYADLAQKYIIRPLGLKDTFFNPISDLKPRIAASEKGNTYEKKMCFDAFPDNPRVETALRSEIIWGEVHDGNCHYLGGAAGNAGLFSTAEGTHQLALQFMSGFSTLLGPETCGLFRKNLTEGLDQARSISFQLAATTGSSAGPDLSPDAFGHLGFTGTSVWVDGASKRVYVLLSNRTHAAKPPFADLAETRKAFHSLSSILLDSG